MVEKKEISDRERLIQQGINPDRDKGVFEVDFQIEVTRIWAHLDPDKLNLENPADVQKLSFNMKQALLSMWLPEDVRSFFSTVTGWD